MKERNEKGQFVKKAKTVADYLKTCDVRLQDDRNYFKVKDYKNFNFLEDLNREKERLIEAIKEVEKFKGDLEFFKRYNLEVSGTNWTWGIKVNTGYIQIAVLNDSTQKNLEALEINIKPSTFLELPPSSRCQLILDSLENFIVQIDKRIEFLKQEI